MQKIGELIKTISIKEKNDLREHMETQVKQDSIINAVDEKLASIAKMGDVEKGREIKSLLFEVAVWLDGVELEIIKKKIISQLGMSSKVINEYLYDCRKQRVKPDKEIPAHIVWEEPRIFCPALDFINETAYVTITLYKEVKGEYFEVPYVIASNRECFPLTKEEMYKRKLIYSGSTYLPESRWKSESIQKFLKNEEGEINAYQVFNEIKELYKQYLDFEETALYDFFSIWCIGTYFHPLFSSFPYCFLSGTRESGKSKCLKLTSRFAFNAEFTASLSTASTFRIVEANRSSLMIDEMENINSGDNPEFRSVILSGYEAGASVLRCGERKDGFEIQRFRSYSPKVFANIAGVEDVLGSRVIYITMSRSGNREISEREIYLLDPKFQAVRNNLYLLLMKHHIEIKDLYMNIHNEMSFSGREWQLWKSIFTIATFLDKMAGTDEVFRTMFDLATKKYDEKSQIGEDEMEHLIISGLMEMIEDVKEVQATELFEFFKQRNPDEMLELTQTKFGNVLRRLKCFEKKRMLNGKNYYLFNRIRLADLAKRYHIEGGQ